MNFQAVYDKASRQPKNISIEDGETAKTEEDKAKHEESLLKIQHLEWIQHPNTKALILFLAKRELSCLDTARNNVGKSQELTEQFLYRSKEIRKIITYVETGRDNTKDD